MTLIKYVEKKFNPERRRLIDLAVGIIADYRRRGYSLTLRQLYYQMVSRDLFPESWQDEKTGSTNNKRSYDKLGDIISDARLAGIVSWEAIEDRTREIDGNNHWDSPAEIVQVSARQFMFDKWVDQPNRVECFLPDTPVVTRGGPVDIAAIEVGDEVLTHTGHFRRVTKVIENEYAGYVLRVKAVGFPAVCVTPEHPFLAAQVVSSAGYKGASRRYRAPSWLRADQLRPFDRLQLAIPCMFTEEAWPERLDGGTRSTPLLKFHATESGYKAIGLYLSEGSIRPDGRTVQFTLATHETAHEQVIRRWAEEFSLGVHTAFGKGTRVVYVYSKALALWLGSEFGSGAYNKRLPGWFMSLPWAAASQTLEFYFRGDGCFCDESRSDVHATTRSHQLQQQIQLKLLWHGFSAAADQVMDHGEPRYRVSVGGASVDRLAEQWGVITPPRGLGRSKRFNYASFYADRVEFPIRSILRVPYSGRVFNLEVEEDHTYSVPFVAHNCWVEKDALEGVVGQAARDLDIDFFSCRGYASMTSLWDAGQRLRRYADANQTPVILHLGDHDPSGIDMTRDILDRVRMFMGSRKDILTVRRIALNRPQIDEYNPPPNPAKATDARYASYAAAHGEECWELDALDPGVIDQLIRDQVAELRDDDLFEAQVEREREARAELGLVAGNWNEERFRNLLQEYREES